MDTTFNMFLENNISDIDDLIKKLLSDGVAKLIENANIEILIILLKMNIINGDIITSLWDIQNNDDDIKDEYLRIFINLCLKNGGDINMLNDDLEPVYLVIWDYLSTDIFESIISEIPTIDYTLTKYEAFFEYLEENHPKEYKKYLKQKNIKKFNI